MNVRRSRIGAAGAAAAALALLAAPRPARALHLLEEELALADRPARPSLAVALAAATPDEPSLDFDLLGAPPAARAVDDRPARLRRTMLKTHQAVGLGLVALQLATTAVGQLSYSDKFGSGAPMTARYEQTHAALAYSTLGAFAVNGALALFAPRPTGKPARGFDRVTLHKIGMATATAGMLAQGALGIYTDRREGYLNQERYARAHLAIGYATLAAVGVAVGALVL